MRLYGVGWALALFAVVMLGAVAFGAGDAEAHGNSPAKRQNAGWECENVPGLGVHCFPPGAMVSSASVPVQVFDTSDPGATHAPFLGTEILIRADLYSGQPCPTDDLEEYEGLDLFPPPGIDFYACHHYETNH